MKSNRVRNWSVGGAVMMIALALVASGCGRSSKNGTAIPTTATPIQHLIVVIGENHGFDNVFATYTPSDTTQSVWNLLSMGIVNADGSAGPNAALAAQQMATDTSSYETSPEQTGAFESLPQPSTTLDALPGGYCVLITNLDPELEPFFCSDPGLDPASYPYLSAPGTGQSLYAHIQVDSIDINLNPVPDCRYPSTLPNAPFWLIGASTLNNCPDPILQFLPPIAPTTYVNNTGDPLHFFYQMWQQNDCNIANATPTNPSGCMHDLYTWVATTVGWDINMPTSPTDFESTFQGAIAMGFYNMAQGDWPVLQSLAQTYSINDNYHQPIMGGTGPNSQEIGTGDVYYYADSTGQAATPPAQLQADPDPTPGSNNYYINGSPNAVDGGNTSSGGYTNCSDSSQPGVAAITNYLNSLPYTPFNHGNCAPNTWYQVTNEYPYYNHLGQPISSSDTNEYPAGPAFAVGPQTIPTIADKLTAAGLSWTYYGAGFDQSAQAFPLNQLYCRICNPFQYATSIMTNVADPAYRRPCAAIRRHRERQAGRGFIRKARRDDR